MKLNKNSWHAKLYNYLRPNSDLPSNLCSYFWIYVGMSLLALFVLIGILGAVFMVFCMIYVFFSRTNESFAAAGIIGWILSIIIGLVVLCSYLNNKIKYKEKKPSIVGSYLKAKKDKICPKIEWEN